MPGLDDVRAVHPRVDPGLVAMLRHKDVEVPGHGLAVDERGERLVVLGVAILAAGAAADAPAAAAHVQVERGSGPPSLLVRPVQLPDHLPDVPVGARPAQVRADLQPTPEPVSLADTQTRAVGGVPEELRAILRFDGQTGRHLRVHRRPRPPRLQRTVLALAGAHRQLHRRSARGARARTRRGLGRGRGRRSRGRGRCGRRAAARGEQTERGYRRDARASPEKLANSRHPGPVLFCIRFPINYIRMRGGKYVARGGL